NATSGTFQSLGAVSNVAFGTGGRRWRLGTWAAQGGRGGGTAARDSAGGLGWWHGPSSPRLPWPAAHGGGGRAVRPALIPALSRRDRTAAAARSEGGRDRCGRPGLSGAAVPRGRGSGHRRA